MINGRRIYVLYLSIRMHFQDDVKFSLTKYGYLTKRSASYDKRNDKYFFDKLAQRYPKEKDAKDFLAANLFHDPGIWVGKLLEEDASRRYLRFCGKKSNLSTVFLKDVKKICKKAVLDKIQWGDSFVKEVLEMYIDGKIEPETFIILKEIYPKIFNQYLDNSTSYAYLYKYIVEAYRYFLSIGGHDKYIMLFEKTYKEELRNWKNCKDLENLIEIEEI